MQDSTMNVLSKLPSKQFAVIHFKDKNHREGAPPHFYVCLPIDNNECILKCMITKQKESKTKYYEGTNQKNAISSLVPVSHAHFDFLTHPSIIDCNQPELITKKGIALRVDGDCKRCAEHKDFGQKLKRDIIAAILGSPIAKPYIKQAIYECP
jgi:hypothetical protein